MGPVDALRVSGARRTQVFLHGVLPAVTPTFVGLVIYRMDSNVRAALIDVCRMLQSGGTISPTIRTRLWKPETSSDGAISVFRHAWT